MQTLRDDNPTERSERSANARSVSDAYPVMQRSLSAKPSPTVVAVSWALCTRDEEPTEVYESVLDALVDASGPYAHLFRWQRLHRRPILNATRALHEFALWCAEAALRRARAGGLFPLATRTTTESGQFPRPSDLGLGGKAHLQPRWAELWAELGSSLRAKRTWLEGKLRDEELRARSERLNAASQDPLFSQLRPVFRAVGAALRSEEVWLSARQAAEHAADLAARERSWLEERKAQSAMLERLLLQLRTDRGAIKEDWTLVDGIALRRRSW